MAAGFAHACASLCVIVALAAPAFTDDADLKKQVEQLGSIYMETFNKQDATGMAALYATGGILVNPAGPHTDLVKLYGARSRRE
jgi:hypothetical protein